MHRGSQPATAIAPPLFVLVILLLCLLHNTPPVVAVSNTVLSSAVVHQDGPAPPCGRTCRFRFCVPRFTTFITAPGNVSNPTVCRLGQEIDRILRTDEARVSTPSGFVPISAWRPSSLTVPFPPNFFVARSIPGESNSGIARTSNKGNQNALINQRCFILPIRRYQRVGLQGNRFVVSTNAENDCVPFVPRTSNILFEAQWLSGDDMDFSVTEPDGTRVDFRNRSSSCGNLINDANIDSCGIREEGIERIFYNRDCQSFQRGSYRVKLSHASNCNTPGREGTKYEVRVLVDGFRRKVVRGFSNANNGQIILDFELTL